VALGRIIHGMTVTHGNTAEPFTQPVSVYRCGCGATVARHGAESGSPPEGWETVGTSEVDEVLHLCEQCAEQTTAR
jgi:hypothetical protein